MNDLDEMRLSRDNAIEFSRQMLAQNTDLRTRLAASEAECLEQARLNGMGSEREAALMAKLAASEAEVLALKAELASEQKSAKSWYEQAMNTGHALFNAERKREEAEKALASAIASWHLFLEAMKPTQSPKEKP